MEADMGEFFKTWLLVSAAAMAWLFILFGWPVVEFQHTARAQDAPPATPALPSIPTNHDLALILQHYEKIFASWAQHANITVLVGVGVVWIVAWMAIKMTRIHVESPRVVHHYHGEWRGQELESQMTPPKQLEPSRGNTLPVAINQRQR
jgi:hypothetical protein